MVWKQLVLQLNVIVAEKSVPDTFMEFATSNHEKHVTAELL